MPNGAVEVLTGVISALVAVILSLLAFLRIYLPKANSSKNSNQTNNPGLQHGMERVEGRLENIASAMTVHETKSDERHTNNLAAYADNLATMRRIEQILIRLNRGHDSDGDE